MKATDAKMLLNEAGFGCAWIGRLTKHGDAFRSTFPQSLLVTKNGKVADIMSIRGKKIEDVRVQELVNDRRWK